MEPRGGTSSTALGRIWPKATTTAISAPTTVSRSGQPGSRSLGGWSTGRPAARARSLTGGGSRCPPRPGGLVGVGDDGGDGVALEKGFERRQRELGRPVEEHLQARERTLESASPW